MSVHKYLVQKHRYHIFVITYSLCVAHQHEQCIGVVGLTKLTSTMSHQSYEIDE